MPFEFILGLVAGGVLAGLVAGFVIRRARLAGEGALEQISDSPSPGKLDLVVGVDGSEESLTALQLAFDLLGTAASSITVATVLDYEARTAPSGGEVRIEAEEMLAEVTAHLEHSALSTQVLYGRPHTALSEFAVRNGKELIVVGARGRGAAEALFGSVTENLIGDSTVPVLVARKSMRENLPFIKPD